MQEIIKKFGIAIVLVILVFSLIGLFQAAKAEDYSTYKELFFINQAGGAVVVVAEPCTIPEAIAKGFEGKAYATEKDGTRHDGCWSMPDTSEAPNHPSIKIIPIVNMYFEGEIASFPQNYFAPLTPDTKGAL